MQLQTAPMLTPAAQVLEPAIDTIGYGYDRRAFCWLGLIVIQTRPSPIPSPPLPLPSVSPRRCYHSICGVPMAMLDSVVANHAVVCRQLPAEAEELEPPLTERAPRRPAGGRTRYSEFQPGSERGGAVEAAPASNCHPVREAVYGDPPKLQPGRKLHARGVRPAAEAGDADVLVVATRPCARV